MNRTEHELELMRRYLDGVASLEETQELESIIMKDASVRQDFLRYTHLDSALAGVCRSQLLVEAPRRSVWRSWHPLTAAAAGIVFGMFCTSVVFAYVGSSIGTALTILHDSFESGSAPEVTGMSVEIEKWGGDVTEIVGGKQGVKPESGNKMLEFLRADYGGKSQRGGSSVADIGRLVDLRPYRKEFGDGEALVQLSAAFNAFEFPANEVYDCGIELHALDEETAMNGSVRSDVAMDTESLAMTRIGRMKLDRDPSTWQRLTGELRLPPNTDFLFIHIRVSHAKMVQRRASFDGHYLDDVRLTLIRDAVMP